MKRKKGRICGIKAVYHPEQCQGSKLSRSAPISPQNRATQQAGVKPGVMPVSAGQSGGYVCSRSCLRNPGHLPAAGDGWKITAGCAGAATSSVKESRLTALAMFSKG